jgi:hypothetical protein
VRKIAVGKFTNWPGWIPVSAIAAVAAVLVAIWFGVWPSHNSEIPVAPPPMVIVEPKTDSSVLTVTQAGLKTQVAPRTILLIFTAHDYLYLLDVLFSNSDRTARTGCQVDFEYAGPNLKGHSALFSGLWVDLYNKHGAKPFFEIPPEPTFAQQFFSFPDPEALRKLDWARVRVQCQHPSLQISPWREVDLTHADWQSKQ